MHVNGCTRITFDSDDHQVSTATTVDEACALVRAGFDYVTDVGNTELFRKRK